MLSERSIGGSKTVGCSLCIRDSDNWKSKIYNGSTSATVTAKKGMTENKQQLEAVTVFALLLINMTALQIQDFKTSRPLYGYSRQQC